MTTDLLSVGEAAAVLTQVTLLGFDSTVFWPRTKRKSNDIGRFLSESRCSGNSTRTELVKC
jgi:hypothetical protein